MKVVFALFLVLAAVYRVAESAASVCNKATAGDATDAGTSGTCDVTSHFCFVSVTVAVTDGAKVFSRGCKTCTVGADTPALNAEGTMWELQNCCNGDVAATTADPAGAANCNSVDLTSKVTVGPTCMKCADSTDEKCVKGGATPAPPYVAGTVACDVTSSSCYVEMKDGKVTRGCKAACADAGKPGDATFTKCCITKNHCNQDDATKTPTDGGDGDGDKDGGAQAVFASYALLFSCLLLAYLK